MKDVPSIRKGFASNTSKIWGGHTCPPVLPVPPALGVCSVCAALLLINIEDDQQQHRHLVCRRRKTMRPLTFWSCILIFCMIFVGKFSHTLLYKRSDVTYSCSETFCFYLLNLLRFENVFDPIVASKRLKIPHQQRVHFPFEHSYEPSH